MSSSVARPLPLLELEWDGEGSREAIAEVLAQAQGDAFCLRCGSGEMELQPARVTERDRERDWEATGATCSSAFLGS